ncbi:hypothetical protein ACQP1G_29650 [Nocardia sp. CA-107356]
MGAISAGYDYLSGDVPTVGSVGVAAMMDFAGLATGLDRLELVG